MIYGYARVSSNGQDLTQQVTQLLAQVVGVARVERDLADIGVPVTLDEL